MNSKQINFFKEDIKFRFSDSENIFDWISKAIKNEGFQKGDINIIFCSDAYLRKMNKQYLQHDYNTDIITFETGDDPSIVNGDLFISIDRVKANSKTLKILFRDELHRVIIHGILHLCNYSDKSPKKQSEMRAQEDYYLGRRKWMK
jgi:rRNA maturation RNase YbeY